VKPRRVSGILFGLVSIPLAAACLFFTYYTVRLVYINLTFQSAAQHRQAGMYIGAVVFPLAALAFGYLSFRCARAAARHFRSG
jgi:hypothetical protein